MTDAPVKRSIVHASFTLEKRYKAAPAKVFAAWAEAKAKQIWFHGPNEAHREPLELDFRIGGKETTWGAAKGGARHRYDGVYLDIVPNQRLILAYHMHIDDKPISASLMSVELFPDGAGTRLKFTEQGAFLDGYDDAGSREEGTRWLLEQLGEALGG
jgi:uncharacterized protein YndB with AHSA1/START domain